MTPLLRRHFSMRQQHLLISARPGTQSPLSSECVSVRQPLHFASCLLGPGCFATSSDCFRFFWLAHSVGWSLPLTGCSLMTTWQGSGPQAAAPLHAAQDTPGDLVGRHRVRLEGVQGRGTVLNVAGGGWRHVHEFLARTASVSSSVLSLMQATVQPQRYNMNPCTARHKVAASPVRCVPCCLNA